jgi:hypothetical protein
MANRFVCRFAVGRDNLAYTGVWRVWTAKNKPDLYLTNSALGGDVKATVHCPDPPRYAGWKRHFGFVKEASSQIAIEAKIDGGPHKLQWSGRPVGAGVSLEYRVIFRGMSLSRAGNPVSSDVTLLPIPSDTEFLEVIVLLAPADVGYSAEASGKMHLLSEGQLSDGRKVWIVYSVQPLPTLEGEPDNKTIPIAKSYVNKDVNLTAISGTLRAATFGVQEDGSLLFMDMRVDVERKGIWTKLRTVIAKLCAAINGRK